MGLREWKWVGLPRSANNIPVTRLMARLDDTRVGKELVIQKGSNTQVRDQTLANRKSLQRESVPQSLLLHIVPSS